MCRKSPEAAKKKGKKGTKWDLDGKASASLDFSSANGEPHNGTLEDKKSIPSKEEVGHSFIYSFLYFDNFHC